MDVKISGESLPLLISTQLDSFFKVRRTAVRRKNKLPSGSLFGIASFHPDSSQVKGFRIGPYTGSFHSSRFGDSIHAEFGGTFD